MARTEAFRHEWQTVNPAYHVDVADYVEELKAALTKLDPMAFRAIVRATDRGNYKRAGELIADALRAM
jgi:hypothetical protein